MLKCADSRKKCQCYSNFMLAMSKNRMHFQYQSIYGFLLIVCERFLICTFIVTLAYWFSFCCLFGCRLSTQKLKQFTEMLLSPLLLLLQSLCNNFACAIFFHIYAKCTFHYWKPTRAKSTSRNHTLCHLMLIQNVHFILFSLTSFDFPMQNTFFFLS